MQIDLTTFILELINFVVLVWILNRFLYKPVQKMMARRRLGIEEKLQKAEAQKKEAEILRQQYEDRLRDWEEEKRVARAELAKELADLRAAGLKDVQQAVDAEKQRLLAAEAKKQADRQRKFQRQALTRAMSFASRFLQRLASPELDMKMVRVLQEDMDGWTPEQLETLIKAAKDNSGKITVTSAHPLTPACQDLLTDSLSVKLDQECQLDFLTDAALITGLRLAVGHWILQANAKNELAFFAGTIKHDR